MADPLDRYGDPYTVEDAAFPSGEVSGRDQALADLAWEKSPENWFLQQLKGFGSGFTNPFGVVGAGAGPLARYLPDSAAKTGVQGYLDTMRRWEDEAPYANTAGSLTAAGRGLSSVFGMSPRNVAHLVGVLMSASPVVRNVQDVITGDKQRREEMQRAREYGAAGMAGGGMVLAQYVPPHMVATRRSEPPESRYQFQLPYEQPPRSPPPPRQRSPAPGSAGRPPEGLDIPRGRDEIPAFDDGGAVDPLAQYRGRPAFQTTNPIINFVRAMDAGRLPPQQAARGWLAEHPTAQAFAERLPMLPLAIGNPAVAWAGRTPGIVRGPGSLHEGGPTITGGRPDAPIRMREAIGLDLLPISESSAGLQARFPNTLRIGSRMGYRGGDPMPPAHYNRLLRLIQQGHDNRNAPPGNLRTPTERSWWLQRIPGGEE